MISHVPKEPSFNESTASFSTVAAASQFPWLSPLIYPLNEHSTSNFDTTSPRLRFATMVAKCSLTREHFKDAVSVSWNTACFPTVVHPIVPGNPVHASITLFSKLTWNSHVCSVDR